jgi:tRNA dimethylallyltransferase
MTKKRAILIAGPTASGKSALALALAEQFGGAIVNADSMQVYRDLRVLTARPSEEDEARVPHRLYGHVPAREAYSAGRYALEARRAIEAVQAEGRIVVIVGGTGLYFKALTEGLSPIPAIPDEIRIRWRMKADEVGAAELHKELAARDAAMAARLRPTDPQRIVRALEVLEATGRSLALWQCEPGIPIVSEAEALRIVIDADREEIHRRCDQRFLSMIEEGAIEEVRLLLKQNLSEDLPVMRALGVRPLRQLVSGILSRDEAIAAAQAETRQYVKRQQTWLKGNMSAWKGVTLKEMQRIITKEVAFILD